MPRSCLDSGLLLDYSEFVKHKRYKCEFQESKGRETVRSDTKEEEEVNENETVFTEKLHAGTSKPHLYSLEYVEEQIEHMVRVNMPLQQNVRTLSGGKLLPEVMIRAMLSETRKL